MKKLLFFVNVCFVINLYSQKAITKTVPFTNGIIEINLGDIDQLILIQTNKKEVSVSTTELDNEASFFTIKPSEKGIIIASKQVQNLKPELPACIPQPLFTTYTIKIPIKAEVIITMQSGNFYSENFSGKLQLDNANGEIYLDNCFGNIQINNIDGIITCITKMNQIKVKNHLGKTFINKPKSKKRNNNYLLNIKTIRGNVFINTAKEF